MSCKIAIIDRGVEAAHPKLSRCTLSGIVLQALADDLVVAVEGGWDEDASGHGTAIAGIIHNIAPDAEVVSVKLAGPANKITESLLYEGIKWCLGDPAIRVINVSLGIATDQAVPLLDGICQQAHRQNVHIVAAANNTPSIECYPAYFPFVHGVASGLVKSPLEYGYLAHGSINILAKGTTRRMLWRNGGYRITSGTSFATGHFSAILWKMLAENPFSSWEAVNACIRQNATPHVPELLNTQKANATLPPQLLKSEKKTGEYLFTNREKLLFAERIALFPASEKEMVTLLEFEAFCTKTITALIDYPRSYKPGTPADGRLIRGKPRPEDMAAFDTLVIGYFLDQQFDANLLFAYELIDAAIAHNKNMIVWDAAVYTLIRRRIEQQGGRYTGEVFISAINQDLFDQVIKFKHCPSSAPAVSVVGTSNKQGKITTQLRVKDVLQRAGYRVAHISSEPQAILLGADFVFPCGHNATIGIGEQLWGLFLNAAAGGVEKYNQPDLVLSGTQGGTIPRSAGLIPDYAPMHFLSGVKPDAVILAVNPHDSPQLITDTLKAIEIFNRAKPLFLVMTPWARDVKTINGTAFVVQHRMESPQFEASMNALREATGIPVIDIMDDKNDPFILESIQHYFTPQGAVHQASL